MTLTDFILQRTSYPRSSISGTLTLLESSATIPFIARYRKERTGKLDETQIAEIVKLKEAFLEIQARKKTILKAVKEQNGSDPELEERINKEFDLARLEDLYLPFKRSRKTRADTAREKGLGPLAKMMMAQNTSDLEEVARKFVNKEVPDTSKALTGARDIVAAWINENARLRDRLRNLYRRSALLVTRPVTKELQKEGAQKFKQYFQWEEALKSIPSHRLLAILRAGSEGFIRVKVEVEKDLALQEMKKILVRNEPAESHFEQAISEAFKRLLHPALSNEILSEAKEKADDQAIQIFGDNLEQLLLAPPLGEKRILAIDPGYKSGCKIVCLDEKGDLLHNETLYPHAPQREALIAMKKIKSLVNAYRIEAISIGNGTASRETENLVKKIKFDREVQVFIVSEAGASVYSASKVARAEFPEYDVTVRGAVSIGRRLADPLAELVKIEPKSIGVGQYQHDVDQVKLKKELERVVERCVNRIGVNVNTASAPLLSFVSGIGPGLAENIVDFRKAEGSIKNRKQLMQVPRLGNAAFEQAAGFLRISHPEHPLDNSAVHPERYPLVETMARDVGVRLEELIGASEIIQKIDPEQYVSDSVGLPTITDILSELRKPGVDPRSSTKIFEFDPRVKTIADLHQGMKIPGIVNNITNFGCFVDIGIKESGLVHISKLAKRFVNDVHTVVKLHQHVEVTVLEIDQQNKRIQLSLID